MWDMHAALVSRRPLVVPLSDIVLWFGDEDVPPSQVLRVLNGAVVGVIAISSAPGTNAHVWTGEEVRTLYQGGKGISDQAAVDLSEQGARTLLRTSVETYQNSHDTHHLANWHMPQIVYGHPSTEHTTLLTHAIVRSVDPTEGSVHLLLPPLVAGTSPAASSDALGSIDRIVGIVKGPGPGMHGIDLPVWPMIGDGFIERAMGSSSVRDLPRFARKGTKGKGRGQDGDAAGGDNDGDNDNALGIQEAPYLSVEADEGIGAATTRSRGGQMRRSLQ
ncbi:hypothetical protein GGI12_006007 [Dipsacomyces acuminosporus]|nr:hypothetical protein GGI12_006007 [Dipsacomyces acuminosporus]